MLKQFGHEVWISDGPDVIIVGFHYPTRMAAGRVMPLVRRRQKEHELIGPEPRLQSIDR
jgi:hypothetical protein